MATRKNETRKREKRFNGKQIPFTATISIRLFVLESIQPPTLFRRNVVEESIR